MNQGEVRLDGAPFRFSGTRHARVTGLWRLGLVLSTPSVQWAEVGRSCSKYREAVQAPLSAVLRGGDWRRAHGLDPRPAQHRSGDRVAMAAAARVMRRHPARDRPAALACRPPRLLEQDQTAIADRQPVERLSLAGDLGLHPEQASPRWPRLRLLCEDVVEPPVEIAAIPRQSCPWLSRGATQVSRRNHLKPSHTPEAWAVDEVVAQRPGASRRRRAPDCLDHHATPSPAGPSPA